MALVIAIGGKPKIFIHDADLSDNGKASTPTLSAETKDATTFADSGVKRKVGNKDISFRFEGLFDGASQKSHAALDDLRANQRIVSIYAEGDAAAKEGIVLSSAHAEQYALGISLGELVPLAASIVQDGVEGMPVVSLAARHTANITATENKAGVDNSGTSADGGTFTVHAFVFSASGGNARWQALLQESSDNGVGDPWVTIATINITAVGAQQATFAGTVEAWLRVRFVLDATSGTLQAHAGAERD